MIEAEDIQAELDKFRAGSHPQSSNGQLYRIGRNLLEQREALADVLEEARHFLTQTSRLSKTDPLQEQITTALRSVGRSV